MPQKLVSILSLFLALGAFVHAFLPSSMTQHGLFPSREKTVLWSSSETSVMEEPSSAEMSSDGDSSPKEEDTFATGNGEKNEDSDFNAMMSEESSDDEVEEENLMQQIKDSGTAGVISYAAWELAFWTVSVPVCVLGYKQVTGHWPDFQDKDDLSKLGAEAFAFVNFARFAVPLRIGLALGTTPWVQENIVDVFLSEKESDKMGDEPLAVEEAATEPEEEESENDDTKSIDDGKNKKESRFRIRSRVGNLVNRVLRRQKQE